MAKLITDIEIRNGTKAQLDAYTPNPELAAELVFTSDNEQLTVVTPSKKIPVTGQQLAKEATVDINGSGTIVVSTFKNIGTLNIFPSGPADVTVYADDIDSVTVVGPVTHLKLIGSGRISGLTIEECPSLLTLEVTHSYINQVYISDYSGNMTPWVFTNFTFLAERLEYFYMEIEAIGSQATVITFPRLYTCDAFKIHTAPVNCSFQIPYLNQASQFDYNNPGAYQSPYPVSSNSISGATLSKNMSYLGNMTQTQATTLLSALVSNGWPLYRTAALDIPVTPDATGLGHVTTLTNRGALINHP